MDKEKLEQYKRAFDDLAQRIDRLAELDDSDPNDNASINGQLAIARHQLFWAQCGLMQDGNIDRARATLQGAEKIWGIQMQRVAMPPVEQAAHSAAVNADNASKKGQVWKRAVIELFRDQQNEYKSLREFCGDYAEMPLRTADGQVEYAPKHDQVYRYLLKVRENGSL